MNTEEITESLKFLEKKKIIEIDYEADYGGEDDYFSSSYSSSSSSGGNVSATTSQMSSASDNKILLNSQIKEFSEKLEELEKKNTEMKGYCFPNVLSIYYGIKIENPQSSTSIKNIINTLNNLKNGHMLCDRYGNIYSEKKSQDKFKKTINLYFDNGHIYPMCEQEVRIIKNKNKRREIKNGRKFHSSEKKYLTTDKEEKIEYVSNDKLEEILEYHIKNYRYIPKIKIYGNQISKLYTGRIKLPKTLFDDDKKEFSEKVEEKIYYNEACKFSKIDKPIEIVSCINQNYINYFENETKYGFTHLTKGVITKSQIDINKAFLSVMKSENNYPIFLPHNELKKYNNEEIHKNNLYKTSYGWMFGDELQKFKFLSENYFENDLEIYCYYESEMTIYDYKFNDKILNEISVDRKYTTYVGKMAPNASKTSEESIIIYNNESACDNYLNLGYTIKKKIADDLYIASKNIENDQFKNPITYKFVNWRIISLSNILLFDKLTELLPKYNDKIIGLNTDCIYFNEKIENMEDNKEIGKFKYVEKEYKLSRTLINNCNNTKLPELYKHSNIKLVDGRAGTGKTYKLCEKYNENENTKILTFTRTAAENINKKYFSMFNKKINKNASTIHRYHGYKETETLDINYGNELFLVDEFSMIPLKIFFNFYKLACNGANFIFYGDSSQLPPVEHSYYYKGILLKKILDKIMENPAETLTKIYRYDGELELLSNKYVYGNKNDKSHLDVIPKINENNIKLNVTDRYLCYLNKSKKIINKKYENMKTNKNAPYICEKSMTLKTSTFKKLIVEKINPKKGRTIENEYFRELLENEFICYDNGMILSYWQISYLTNCDEFKNFKLSFAITIHKMQGGCFEKNIIPTVYLKDVEKYTRPLLYTALTRCQELKQLKIII